MKPTLKQLRHQRARLQKQIDAIETAKERRTCMPLVGKCFRFENSYGCDKRKWWLYAKVLRADEDAWLITLQFQTDCTGRVTLEPEVTQRPHHLLTFQEISDEEFEQAFFELNDFTDRLFRKIKSK